ILRVVRRAEDCFADATSRNKSQAHLANCLDRPNATRDRLLDKKRSDTAEKVRLTHHGGPTFKGEAARRSSDMRQARHYTQRWYWDIVVQNPSIGIRRTNHQPIDRSGLTPASRLRRSMGQRARNRNPRLHFPRYGSPHTANMRVRLKNQS
ncbi:hypothetical protein TNCV_4260091, partial [Trichonephila clavipes]